MYRGVFGRETIYYIQDLYLVPPIFPFQKMERISWSKIRSVDDKELKDYTDCINHQHSRQRTKKLKLDDVVDMENRIMGNQSKTEGFGTLPLIQYFYSYWSSSKVILLFNTIVG